MRDGDSRCFKSSRVAEDFEVSIAVEPSLSFEQG
jgi:hypothetical protein